MTKPNSRTKKKNTSAEVVIEEILKKDKESLRVSANVRAGKPSPDCHGACGFCRQGGDDQG
jgi:hypothetical protein